MADYLATRCHLIGKKIWWIEERETTHKSAVVHHTTIHHPPRPVAAAAAALWLSVLQLSLIFYGAYVIDVSAMATT